MNQASGSKITTTLLDLPFEIHLIIFEYCDLQQRIDCSEPSIEVIDPPVLEVLESSEAYHVLGAEVRKSLMVVGSMHLVNRLSLAPMQLVMPLDFWSSIRRLVIEPSYRNIRIFSGWLRDLTERVMMSEIMVQSLCFHTISREPFNDLLPWLEYCARALGNLSHFEIVAHLGHGTIRRNKWIGIQDSDIRFQVKPVILTDADIQRHVWLAPGTTKLVWQTDPRVPHSRGRCFNHAWQDLLNIETQLWTMTAFERWEGLQRRGRRREHRELWKRQVREDERQEQEEEEQLEQESKKRKREPDDVGDEGSD